MSHPVSYFQFKTQHTHLNIHVVSYQRNYLQMEDLKCACLCLSVSEVSIPLSFCSFIPVLGNGLYYKDDKVGQVLAVGVGSVRSALLHHRRDGHLEWAADGRGDQRHPGPSEYQLHLCDD